MTLHPDDAELISAHAQLRGHGFIPPAPRELPTGTPAEVRARLERRSQDELALLAGALVTLPEPAHEPAAAGAALELLLAVPGEDARAERLLAALEAHGAPPEACLSWRFRLGAMRLSTSEQADSSAWDALLDPARAAAPRAPAAAAAALRLAAARWLAATERTAVPGASWVVPVLHGRRVANAGLARLRRPALAAPDALGPAFGWLDEANALDPRATTRGPEGLVAAADEADRAGDVDLGSRLLLDAAAAAMAEDGLDQALTARAALLVDPSLGAAAAATQTQLAHRVVPPPAATRPEPPRRDWTARVLALAAADGAPHDDTQLALCEVAGAPGRAARAWLQRGDRPALLQAARLADALSGPERDQLARALAAVSADDEQVLATDAGARDAAIARWWLLPAGLERRLLRARLAALLPEPPGVAPLAGAEDDPHSVDNRLAAASDLLAAGRLDAAVAVLTALLKRVEDTTSLARLAGLCARALEHEPAPLDLVEAVDKHLRAASDTGRALLAAFTANPAGAFAVHELLVLLGSDVSRADAYRVGALSAWLGIWRATRTPPDDSVATSLARADGALLALAAGQLARHPDPVALAVEHLERHPLGADDGPSRAEDLLALALAGPA